MKRLKSLSIDSLECSAVLLVDTEDKQFKMVPKRSNGPMQSLYLYVTEMDSDETETDVGNFVITNITVGKSINGIACPQRRDDGVMELGKSFSTTPVTIIEMY